MASRISQMRSAIPNQQQIMNERAKLLMQQFKSMPNPQSALTNLIQQNPQLASIIKNGNNLEGIARSMAQAKGIDINQLINQLQGGF